MAYPKPIADILSQLIARRGYARQRSTASLESAWRQAVGEKFAATTPRRPVRRGTLEVTVPNNLGAQKTASEKKRKSAAPAPPPPPKKTTNPPSRPAAPNERNNTKKKKKKKNNWPPTP